MQFKPPGCVVTKSIPFAIRWPVVIVLLALMFAAQPGVAQQVETGTTPAAAPVAQDPFGRDTPRGLVEGLLGALARGDYQQASVYLDLAAWPTSEHAVRGPQLARQLQTVLDRQGQFLTFAELSSAVTGRLTDGLDADLERLGALRAAEETYPILARRSDVDEVLVWRLAEETLIRIPGLAFSSVETPVDVILPTSLKETSVFGAPVGHWLALIAIALLSAAAAVVPVYLLIRQIDRAPDRHQRRRAIMLLRASAMPLGLILGVILVTTFSTLAGVSIVARATAGRVAEVVVWIALAWLLWRVIDAVSEFSIQQMSRRQRPTGVSAVALARRALKTIVVFIVALLALDTIGVDMTAGIAALGIGGLALALGAQKTIENFVGSLTLVVDRPVQVGDFCRFGDTLGTVEDIGMRSTRIRTLDRTVVTIPNGDFSTMQIENLTIRDQFLLKHELTLQYDTTNAQLRQILADLRELLEGNPSVVTDGARARFIEFGSDALIVELFAYVRAKDWADSLRIREDINLRIIEIVEEAGAGFAFPTRTIHLSVDDAQKIADVAARKQADPSPESDKASS